jgi:hypothetical protein
MSQIKFALLLSAVAGASVAAYAAAPNSFELKLPAPRVPVNQALSPNAIAVGLRESHMQIQEMYRKGPAYAVVAIGPNKNKVLLMVDGRSGEVIGMNVLAGVVPITPSWVPIFVNDRHPFGVVVPEVIYQHWDRYTEAQWTQPGAKTIAVRPTYAPYRYVVPHSFVHVSPNTHKSYAIAPPSYRGYRLRDSAGKPVRETESRADAADAAAAYESERADQATFDKADALQRAAEANQRPAGFDQENTALADYATQQEKRAEEAHARADAANKKLEAEGHADDPCVSDCQLQADNADPAPEPQGERAAAPEPPSKTPAQ